MLRASPLGAFTGEPEVEQQAARTGYVRGRAKTQVALRNGFSVSLGPRLAEFTTVG
jgi:hypothetical protein